MSRLSSLLGADTALEGDQVVLLRKLGKKAVETKVKALQELREAVPVREPEWSAAILPQWALHFAKLADDASWQVREAACQVLGLLAQQLKKRLAPHLKSLLAPWLRCRFDAQHDVRNAATAAFSAAFPGEGNYVRALALFAEDVTRALGEAATAAAPARSGDEAADAEASEGHTRRVCTALQAAAHLITESAAASPTAKASGSASSAAGLAAKANPLLEEHLLVEGVWRLATSPANAVRCALYGFAHVLLQHAPPLAAASAAPLAAVLLAGLKEQEAAAHAVGTTSDLMGPHGPHRTLPGGGAGPRGYPRLSRHPTVWPDGTNCTKSDRDLRAWPPWGVHHGAVTMESTTGDQTMAPHRGTPPWHPTIGPHHGTHGRPNRRPQLIPPLGFQ